ncbi:conjugative transfer signal peptidase TraF [Rhodohalobacter sp. 614A]|uniref:conjugative transfer signal peptidase TraF n=1 Tax=Rhodohalobacter sp. 614A TaxID=2908649 RepID=UPI001F163714|nr:conjugative transfer signal peptidase TraF [Rhodohalobacter sp. 614A]
MRILKENAFIIGGATFLLVLWLSGPRVAINTSESLPIGIYFITQTSGKEVGKGDLVLFYDEEINKKAAERKYIREGHMIGKRVAAVGGENIRVGPKQTTLSGIPVSGKAPRTDSKGRPMQRFLYNGVVPDGTVFLLGDTDNSYDSRYYGFVEISKITGTLTPLFIW